MVSLPDNLMTIQQRIRAACTRAGREAASVTLLAVSKTHPPGTIEAAVSCGLLHFGENKVQEAKAKIPLCPGKARWQFIGHLQSNKVRDAVELFEMIQSVDSLSLAREIAKRAEQAAKTMPILLEVNVAGEASKFGYEPKKLLAEIDGVKCAAENRNPRSDGHPAFFAAAGAIAPLFPTAARTEDGGGEDSRLSPASFEHGNER